MTAPPHDKPPRCRADLAGCIEQVIRPASRAKPAILLVRCGGHRVVVKDFSQNGWLLRNLYGRYIVGHECRIYRQLDGVAGVPVFHGRLDAFAFAADYVEARTLKRLGYGVPQPEAFDRLARLFEALHQRGVVHLDAHQKTNVLLDEGGQPYLMDFATALYLGRGWLSRRVLVPLIGRADWRGWLKLKARYCPEALTPSERGRWRLMKALGMLWPWTLIRRLRRELGKKRQRHREGAQRDGTEGEGD